MFPMTREGDAATRQRVVLHMDLDAFFASVEELDHPEWAGHPLVVGADPQEGRGRGVVATCNYAARKFGIHSAMPISEAYRRCPEARYVRPRFERYAAKSDEVFEILHATSEMVEPASIDEAYLDVTPRVASFDEGVRLAGALQRRIQSATRLSASLGVATNRLVAKVASDVRKPGGLTPVPPGTEAAFLAPMPVRRIPGVGPKSEARLGELDVATCGELAALAPSLLQREFGVWGPRLAALARGEDDSPVQTQWARKSLGGETTFPRDTDDPAEWARTLDALSQEAAEGLAAENVLARTITLKVRLTGFETYTRARTLPHPVERAEAIAHVARGLLAESPPTRAVRLLGLRMSGLVPRGAARQTTLAKWPADVLGESGAWRPAQQALDRWALEGDTQA